MHTNVILGKRQAALSRFRLASIISIQYHGTRMNVSNSAKDMSRPAAEDANTYIHHHHT